MSKTEKIETNEFIAKYNGIRKKVQIEVMSQVYNNITMKDMKLKKMEKLVQIISDATSRHNGDDKFIEIETKSELEKFKEGKRCKRNVNIIKMINTANKLLDVKGKEELMELLVSKGIECRMCSHCNRLMIDGYMIDGGIEYYCKDKCLHAHISKEKFEELYDDGNSETFWTSWLD